MTDTAATDHPSQPDGQREGQPDAQQLRKENADLREELSRLKHAGLANAAAIEASEKRFSLAMQGANDGLWDWNLETDEVYYSPRWNSMLGYAEDELGNTLDTWKNLVHPDDQARILAAVNDYLEGRSNAFEAEMRMVHKQGHEVHVLTRAFCAYSDTHNKPVRLVGTHVDISARTRAEEFNRQTAEVLEMIARGHPAAEIYDAIALIYERRHPGMRCSLLELEKGRLLHGGAPSLPKAYCDAVHGLRNGPNVGSCGTSTFTGERCLVEDISTDPKWAAIKDAALPHGLRSCWSEPIKDSRGQVLGAFGMYYNSPGLPTEEESEDLISAARLAGIVMERDQNQKRIRELAYSDELTGLASRAYFYLHMAERLKTAARYARSFSLLYLDLDNFKDINDSLGHDAGDLVLREIARRIERTKRETDFLTRLSGDEFSLVVESGDEALSAGKLAQRCLDAVAPPLEVSGRTLMPTCSIGIARYPEDGESLMALMKAADTALYAAKDQGRNRYAYYQLELTEQAEKRFRFEQALRESIEQQQLTLVYQPQIDTESGKISGVEALLRWQHPQLGEVQPEEFVPVAERIGLIAPLTDWVIATACAQAAAWARDGFDGLTMAVNVPPSLFLDDGLANRIGDTLEKTGLPSAQLELEITEGTIQTSLENVAIVEQLRAMGVSLAIDDFGIGYASFASLKHLRMHRLKIDKYFVDDLAECPDTRGLIEAMIDIGHNLGHKIVAEGVEQPAQREFMKKLGCETLQGFLFSPPVAAEQIPALLQQRFDV